MKKITHSLILMVFTVSIGVAQNIITVDNSADTGAQFSDLQEAINSAQAGDVIYVQPSETDYGNILVDKPLTLIGYAHSDPDKQSIILDLTLGQNASNVRVAGLQVDDLFVTNAQPITNLILESNLFEGDLEFRNGGVNNLVVRGNIIENMGGNIRSFFTNVIVSNNIFKGNNGLYVLFNESITINNNIFLGGGVRSETNTSTLDVQNSIFIAFLSGNFDYNRQGLNFEHCLAYNAGPGTVTPLQGINNLANLDPLFESSGQFPTGFEALEDDYRLQPTSPGIGAGIDGVDLGVYDGSNFRFSQFGFTNGIPTVKIQSISTAVGPDQNLNVLIQATNN